MKLFYPTACDFMAYKGHKIGLNVPFQYVESVSGPNTSPVLPAIIVSPFITIFFWSSSHSSFVTVSSTSLLSCIYWLMTCCFGSSFRHAMQVGVSGPKIISLYPVMVFLMASSSSSFVFIQFWWGYIQLFCRFWQWCLVHFLLVL